MTALGMDKDLGSFAPGKLADIIVIDGDSLQEIHNSEKVQWTMVNGRLYDAATMNELGRGSGREGGTGGSEARCS